MTRNEILNSLLSEMKHSEFIEAEELATDHFDKEILNNLSLRAYVSSGIDHVAARLSEDITYAPYLISLIGHELVMLGYRLAKAEMEIEKLEAAK